MDKAAAIGTFDGIHRGHRIVLDLLKDCAQSHELQPLAITFDRHPLALIDPTRTPPSLSTLQKKKKLLNDSGVTPLILEFNEDLRKKTAEEWMKIMHDDLGVKFLVIGYDNTFGSDGVNLSVADYQRLGKKIGINVIVAPELKNVSSSKVRKAIVKGEVENAAEMLGRPFSLTGTVVDGNILGRTIGFPTANLKPDEGIVVPKSGVYAVRAKLPDGELFPAIVNIGKRPTVKRGDNTVIEAHIIGWNGNLYGKQISLRFLKRLRNEQEFDSIEALKRQILNDKEEALKIC